MPHSGTRSSAINPDVSYPPLPVTSVCFPSHICQLHGLQLYM